MEGSLRERGDSVMFDVRLVDANTGEQLWGHRYTRAAHDLAGIQDSVADAIAGRLARGRDGHASDWPNAGQRRGLRCVSPWHLRRSPSLAAAAGTRDRGLRHRVVRACDRARPSIRLPHTAIAAMLTSRFFIRDPNPAWEERAFVEIEKALSSTPTWPRRISRRAISLGRTDFTKRQRLHRRRRALKPSFVDPHASLGSLYMHVGLLDRALAEYDTALALDPDDDVRAAAHRPDSLVPGQVRAGAPGVRAFAGRALGGAAAERGLVLNYLGRPGDALALLDSAEKTGAGAQGRPRRCSRGHLRSAGKSRRSARGDFSRRA